MSNSRTDSKVDVEQFLLDLKGILNSDTFVVQRDLDILPKKKLEAANDPYVSFHFARFPKPNPLPYEN